MVKIIAFLLKYETYCSEGKYMEPSRRCAIISITIFRDDPDLITVVILWTCTNEHVPEKTNNSGLRPGSTQTRLYSHRIKREA